MRVSAALFAFSSLFALAVSWDVIANAVVGGGEACRCCGQASFHRP